MKTLIELLHLANGGGVGGDGLGRDGFSPSSLAFCPALPPPLPAPPPPVTAANCCWNKYEAKGGGVKLGSRP